MAKRCVSHRSIPLCEAVWHFASRRLKSEAKQVKSLPGPKYPKGIEKNPIRMIEKWGQVATVFLEHKGAVDAPIMEMRKQLLQRLQIEKLEAWGVQVKPELGETLTKIPTFIFKNKPKMAWANNAVENLRRRYEGVEIRRTTEIWTVPQTLTKLAKKRPGRPRVDSQIIDVVRELIREGSFRGKSEKQRVSQVQKLCQTRYQREFPKISQPSPTKIREILKREGI